MRYGISGHWGAPDSEFDGDSDSEGQRRKRQSYSTDYPCCSAIGGELAKAAHSERKTDPVDQQREGNGSRSLKVSLKRARGRPRALPPEARAISTKWRTVGDVSFR